MRVGSEGGLVTTSGAARSPASLPRGRRAVRADQRGGEAGVQPGREGEQGDPVPLPRLRADHRVAPRALRAAGLRDREPEPLGGRPDVLPGAGRGDLQGEVGELLLPALGALPELHHGGVVV